jgi:hypothetical protein
LSAAIGRGLQVVGLTLVGVGLFFGLARNDLRYEERMFFAGAGVFFVGWLLVRRRGAGP